NYAANRRTIALSQIPLALTVNSTLATQNGYLFTATPSVALFGAANAIDTRKVLVNGAQANWSAFNASWTANATLQPGINRVLVQSLNSNDVEFARATVDIWYDDGSVTGVSGAIASDTTWTAATGPYNVTGTITVNSGVTLTIQAGTTLYLDSGVNITVANGGRLLAEGTETAPIRFSRTPGTATSWGGITVNGAVGSPETRIAYAHFEFNGSTAIHSSSGTLFLDHLTFGNTAVQYVSLDGSSFVVQECVFPATTASFEPVHGTAGIKSGGRGIVRRNFWGRVNNYNDSFDFTGGNRPGPILQVLNNVFMGSDDDILDLDSTDAWVEGNIFLHCHRNGASPDSSSAVSGGSDNADNSQVTIIGNLIFDCDQAANGKQTNFYTLINNTIVHQTHVGGIDPTGAVVILADDGTSQGAGMYLEGNIISDAENLTRNVTTAIVTFTNNIITQLQGAPWSGQGGENVNVDPTFVHLPTIAETTNFTTWAEAQVLWQWFSLRAGSPARGTGPGGRDKGAVIPLGASISGEPVGGTPLNSATLHVGPNRTGFGIPVNGFPNGSGFTHYKWRLDGGPWSAETPVATDITLSGLGAGPHYVEVTAKNDAGFYQDDPVFGPDASVTVSRTWTVNPAASPLRLNEILASNAGALVHSNTTPDAIELYNAGPNELDLSGISLTDDPSDPAQFLFPPDTSLAAGAYLVVFANNPDGTPGFHLGFNLPQSGGAVYLYDSPDNGGALLDSIAFGLQLTDLSIGRLGDGSWSLTQPTFGAANKAAPLGDPTRLRLNEWLAIGVTAFDNDFIELYNGDPLPVNVGGLYLSDEPLGWPNRHQIAALSFISGNGYQRFIADGDAGSGAEHLNFHLSGVQGSIGLYLPNLTPIDCITYQPQRLNVSQGRSPNGSANIVFFDTPTPGAPNPLVTGPAPNGGVLVINEVLAANASIAEVNGRTPDWIELYNGTTNTANLADLSLTDDTLQPRRFVFGAGTTLAPGGYLRVLCDDGRPATTNNTGFALKSTGGGIYLFDALANGGSLLNSVIYGLQTPNLSIGRVPDGSTNWVLTSPTRGTANVAIPNLGDTANLKVNEWMADPGPGKDDWFEIYNPNPLPVALGGLHLTDDLSDRTKHKIAALSFLGTGTNAWQQFHADGNTGAGADHVGFSLKSGGEDVGISTASGTLINGVSFGQQLTGVSEGRFPDGSTNVVSFPGTDSPGASNYRRLTTVVINEVLTHTDLPLEDAIELQNLTAQPIDVGGWWLSDDNGTLQKYQIPSPTILPASGFTVIYETHFTNRNEAALPFALSSAGDETVLSAAANNALTGYRTSVKFGAAQNGVSFGRYLNSVDEEQFVALSARTFGVDDPSSVEQFRNGSGATNAYPRVGPVVISEIMYHPPDAGTNDNVADEFIELHNITTAPVPLYDPAAPANTWHLRDAVDFDFPPGRVMAPGDYLLVVSFDPANNPAALTAFRAKYHVAAGTGIVGPYSGKLANNDDDIELRRPDTPNTNDVPYILVEHVHYFDTAPWTPLADGTGYSLQRIADNLFGNDPSNWTAATATAGPQAVSFDSDGDGMPDAWETEHGLDPFNRLDGMLDTDGDGLTNLQEYQLGSDPRNAQSGLRIESITLAANGTNVVLTFTAIANWTYSIEYIDDLGSGGWTALGGSGDIAAAPAPRSIQLTVPVSTPKRFYRLRTPWRFGPAGGLQITSIQPLPGNQVALSLNAPANLNCTVLYTTDIAAGQWTLVTSYSAVPTNRVIQLMAPASNSSGFFRLRSP
ncbi:MAG TPA: lamin tail domain-containing protein, partial [Verrucomicrobiae bacterium]